jgi:hypothetical protein
MKMTSIIPTLAPTTTVQAAPEPFVGIGVFPNTDGDGNPVDESGNLLPTNEQGQVVDSDGTPFNPTIGFPINEEGAPIDGDGNPFPGVNAEGQPTDLSGNPIDPVSGFPVNAEGNPVGDDGQPLTVDGSGTPVDESGIPLAPPFTLLVTTPLPATTTASPNSDPATTPAPAVEWFDSTGTRIEVAIGTNPDGTLDNTILIDSLPGKLEGNTITIPNPADPTKPIIGVIAPNAQIIIWDQKSLPPIDSGILLPVTRVDVDECADPTLNDCNSVAKPATVCFNLIDSGYVCNCDISDTAEAPWLNVDGETVTVNVGTDGVVTMLIAADGTALQGDIRENTITVTPMPDGTTATGTINKNDDGNTMTTTIVWSDPTLGTWTRDTQSVTIPVTTTAATTAATTAGAVGANGNGIGSVTGDPHFRIDFGHKRDVCFDFNGGQGAVMNLINDKNSGLIINGMSIYKNRLGKIGFVTPAGVKVEFNMDNIVVSDCKACGDEPFKFSYEEAVDAVFDDIVIETHVFSRYKRHGATIQVDESLFELSLKEEKHSMKFYIEQESHVKDHDMGGLLGFTMAKDYQILDEQTLTIADEKFNYILNEHEDCLVLEQTDVYSKLMVQHSLHESFLLQRPIQLTLSEKINPK